MLETGTHLNPNPLAQVYSYNPPIPVHMGWNPLLLRCSCKQDT